MLRYVLILSCTASSALRDGWVVGDVVLGPEESSENAGAAGREFTEDARAARGALEGAR